MFERPLIKSSQPSLVNTFSIPDAGVGPVSCGQPDEKTAIISLRLNRVHSGTNDPIDLPPSILYYPPFTTNPNHHKQLPATVTKILVMAFIYLPPERSSIHSEYTKFNQLSHSNLTIFYVFSNAF